VPDRKLLTRAHLLLGESAFRNNDLRTAADALATAFELTPAQTLMLADARLRLGDRVRGLQALDDVARLLPDDDPLQAERRRLERTYRPLGTDR
jgi:hypothetical protein